MKRLVGVLVAVALVLTVMAIVTYGGVLGTREPVSGDDDGKRGAPSTPAQQVEAAPPAQSQQPPVAEQPNRPSPSEDERVFVYVSESARTYHRRGCKTLAKLPGRTIAFQLRAAKGQSFVPCVNCKPPQ